MLQVLQRKDEELVSLTVQTGELRERCTALQESLTAAQQRCLSLEQDGRVSPLQSWVLNNSIPNEALHVSSICWEGGAGTAALLVACLQLRGGRQYAAPSGSPDQAVDSACWKWGVSSVIMHEYNIVGWTC